jgi:hypothetical protein
MSNHFTAVGLPVVERDDLSRVIGAALRTAVAEPVGGRRTLAVWREESGAQLDVLLQRPRWRGQPTVECATPQYVGTALQTVRVTGVVDDACAGCALATVDVLEGGELLYPLAVAPARVAALRGQLEKWAASGEPVPASLVLVAENIAVYPDKAAFTAAMAGDDDVPGFAPESLVPVGLFGTDPPAPAALMHGTVTTVRRAVSSAFGAAFWHLTVRTFGEEFDVVVAADEVAEVEVGNVVAVQAWVCGRIGEVA